LKVELIEVQGDQVEFADLLGCSGKLEMEGERGYSVFYPENRGDWLHMSKIKSRKEGDKISIFTTLGNKFVFKAI